MKINEQLLQALAVTAEVCGGEISPEAARVMVADLGVYEPADVMKALLRVRREHSGRLTLAAILQRVPSGHPGVEEAWAKIPKDENETAVITPQMLKAWAACESLYEEDRVAARMAFKEAYTAAMTEAPPKPEWIISLGFRRESRAGPVAEAVADGRITLEQAIHRLPEAEESLRQAISRQQPQITQAVKGIADHLRGKHAG